MLGEEYITQINILFIIIILLYNRLHLICIIKIIIYNY